MPAYKITSRWITWALLEHKQSKTRISWVQTHLDANVERRGHPKREAGQRVRSNLEAMKRLSETVGKLARVGEVIVGGDFNIDAFWDSRVQDRRFPFAALMGRGSDATLPGLRSVYGDLGFKRPGTSNGMWIDYLLTWKRPPAERILSFTDYRVLAPVNSDHNPVHVDPAPARPEARSLVSFLPDRALGRV